MKKIRIKKPIYHFSDMNEEIHNKFFSVAFLGAFLFLLLLVFGIVKKDISLAASSLLAILLTVLLIAYLYYMFAYDKVGVIEGELYKIINRKGVYSKYKDVYIRDGQNNTFILTISKFKRDYIKGVFVRIYVSHSNVMQNNGNTWNVRNPIIMTILSADYEEGESDDVNDKYKKSIFKSDI